MVARLSEQLDAATTLRNAFPASLAEDVSAVLDLIPIGQHPPSTHDIGSTSIAGEQVRIPYRFYSDIPKNFLLTNLEPQHQAIFSCIYTRHHNGFVRQEFAGHLINVPEPWVVLFLFQLVGEYVCEIIQLLVDHLPELNRDIYVQFAAENPRFIDLTRRRVISHWDRSRIPRFRDYPGYQIMDAFGLWRKHYSPRLLSG